MITKERFRQIAVENVVSVILTAVFGIILAWTVLGGAWLYETLSSRYWDTTISQFLERTVVDRYSKQGINIVDLSCPSNAKMTGASCVSFRSDNNHPEAAGGPFYTSNRTAACNTVGGLTQVQVTVFCIAPKPASSN